MKFMQLRHGIKPCKKCDGDGVISKPHPFHDDPFYVDEVTCDECSGTGVAPAAASDARTLDDMDTQP